MRSGASDERALNRVLEISRDGQQKLNSGTAGARKTGSYGLRQLIEYNTYLLLLRFSLPPCPDGFAALTLVRCFDLSQGHCNCPVQWFAIFRSQAAGDR